MIQVLERPEPLEFDAEVRTPGSEFLAKTPKPTRKQFNSHDYWRRILPQLYQSYDKICAFSCHWIPPDTGFRTVEHFKSKMKNPGDAYEWKNYRLVAGALNGRKGEHTDVLDPFKIEDGWFVINFPSMLVEPSDELSPKRRGQVEATISRLKLNDDGSCVSARLTWIQEYCNILDGGDEQHAYDFLMRYAPFVGKELERQGLRGRIPTLLNARSQSGVHSRQTSRIRKKR